MKTPLGKTETTPARISVDITKFTAQLEQWLAAKISADALAPAIDAFLATSAELDRMLVPHPGGRWCAEPERYAAAQRRKLAENRYMVSLAYGTAKSKKALSAGQITPASNPQTARTM
jgi:alcohol dehydrogenase class IV